MKPMFALCPYCSFPVVVHPVEIGSPRRCRQCREEYVPGETPRRETSMGKRADHLAGARVSLRAAVRQQRRSLK